MTEKMTVLSLAGEDFSNMAVKKKIMKIISWSTKALQRRAAEENHLFKTEEHLSADLYKTGSIRLRRIQPGQKIKGIQKANILIKYE